MWIRSYYISDHLQRSVINRNGLVVNHLIHQFGSGKGGLFVARHYSTQVIFPENVGIFDEEQFIGQVSWHSWKPMPPKYGSWFNHPDIHHVRFGFSYKSTQQQTPEFTVDSRAVIFPWAVPFLVFALLPICHVRNYRKARRKFRRSHNLCLSCGYDLRASPDKCPECGAASQPVGT
jgi:hypothetical protein